MENLTNTIKSAKKGCHTAQLLLVNSYYFGATKTFNNEIISRDYEKTYKWVNILLKNQKYLKQTKGQAELILGRMYYYGNGTKKNLKLAFNWTKKAADAGNSMGLNDLAYYYENGINVELNLSKATSLYKKAIKKDPSYQLMESAIKCLNLTKPKIQNNIISSQSKEYIDEYYSRAFKITKQVAYSSKPIWFSYIMLSSMYLNGVGCKKDLDRAYTWLSHAFSDYEFQIKSYKQNHDKFFKKMSKVKDQTGNLFKSELKNFRYEYLTHEEVLDKFKFSLSKTNKTQNELILRQAMLLFPEQSVQIEASTNYEYGKQVFFPQSRLIIPPYIAQSGPYYDKLEAEAEADAFNSTFYETTGGLEGMSDSEREMFED